MRRGRDGSRPHRESRNAAVVVWGGVLVPTTPAADGSGVLQFLFFFLFPLSLLARMLVNWKALSGGGVGGA